MFILIITGSADVQLQVTVVALNQWLQIWNESRHPAWMWTETWLVTGGVQLWDVLYYHSSFVWSQVFLRFCWGWFGASTAGTETRSTLTSVDLFSFCHVRRIPVWSVLDVFWSLTFLDHVKIALVWFHWSDVLPVFLQRCSTGVPKGH